MIELGQYRLFVLFFFVLRVASSGDRAEAETQRQGKEAEKLRNGIRQQVILRNSESLMR